MEDYEKITHREYQRREILGKLDRLTVECIGDHDISDEQANRNCFYAGLITRAIEYVHDLRLQVEHPDSGPDVYYSTACRFFSESIIPVIEQFTPVVEERRLIAANYLVMMTRNMSEYIHRAVWRFNVPPERAGFLRMVGLDPIDDVK
ncbi:MAG: hypothetical protein AAB691_00220 [Patescibacteria group bacterium]